MLRHFNRWIKVKIFFGKCGITKRHFWLLPPTKLQILMMTNDARNILSNRLMRWISYIWHKFQGSRERLTLHASVEIPAQFLVEDSNKVTHMSVMKENKDDPDTGSLWKAGALMLIITFNDSFGEGVFRSEGGLPFNWILEFSGNSNLNLEMLLFKIWFPWALELTHRNSANLTPIFQSITGVWHHPIIVLSASRWKWRQMKWK